MARKPYTREFKLQALEMLTDHGLSVAEVSRRLGVTEGSVPAWREAAGGAGRRPPRGTAARPRPTTRSAAPGPRAPASGPGGAC